VPLNINDSDLLPHLKNLPAPREGPTECLFMILQCETADFVRHAHFYLGFVSPFLKSLAKDLNSAKPLSVDELEEMIENKYLKHCDPQVPLQFISSCMSRSLLGKWRFGEYLSQKSNKQDAQPPVDREKIFVNAIQMIELDTMVQTSPHAKGFLWFTNFNLPFPSYVYLVQELRRSTWGPLVDRAWEAMAVNFEVRKLAEILFKSPRFRSFSGTFVKAWEARQSVLEEMGEAAMPPTFISNIRALIAAGKQSGLTQSSPSSQDFAMAALSGMYPAMMQRPMDSDLYSGSTPENFATNPTGLDADGDQQGFGQMDWTFMNNMMGGNSLYSGGLFGDGTQGVGSTSFGTWMMGSVQME
jgi:hypothetical protein